MSLLVAVLFLLLSDSVNLLMYDVPLLGGQLHGLFNCIHHLRIVGLEKLRVVQRVNPVAHKDSHRYLLQPPQVMSDCAPLLLPLVCGLLP